MADELVVLQRGAEWRYALNTDSVTLGRGAHNDVIIAGELASRAHARLTRADGVWRIEDLGSANGTRVNGAEVRAASLGPEDEIEIGGARLRVQPRPDDERGETVLGATLIDEAAQLEAGGANAIPRTLTDTTVARLTIRFEGRTWETPLRGPVTTIGRDPDNDIQLDHPRVSRRHARVETGPAGVALADMGSSNGTRVDGVKIDRYALTGGEGIRIGPARLVYTPVFDPEQLLTPPAAPAGAPRRRPIVFIPGFMGSQLWQGERLVWPNLRLLMTQPEVFKLPETEPLTVRGLVEEVVVVPNLFAQEQYSQLTDFLRESLGYEAGADLLPFAYDWRRDLRAAAARLRDELAAWRAARGAPDEKVILIAHSMGCLVARYFIDVLGGDRMVARAILMGGPQLGTPKSLVALLTGKGLLPFGLLGDKLRDAVATFPGAYQLLPIYPAVFDTRNNPVDLFGDPRWADEPFRGYVADARRFRSELSPKARIPTLCIVGYGSRTVSRAIVTPGPGGRWSDIQFVENPDGDSTIPVDSALLEGAEFHPVRQTHGALFADQDVKFRLRLELLRSQGAG
ncbi:MAG TPA: FHA domain-containing protein [Thermoflexales bacterium]|nr:FHA domain-containing protein [Anaerolineae bacterium]HQV29183.1 FHA domain-containing protein [Thermoflexales bacterium]HQZ54565.1 FHA domain-containing protein [Thermoflexales bacterium]HRA53057.1 FHA domain-containing protein [Thermoflexales bacterium]